MSRFHSTSVISKGAKIGKNVKIGPFSIVHAGSEVLENTIIGSHCEIGIVNQYAQSKNLVVGPNSLIRSHSVIYSGSVFGDHLMTGHGVVIRENCKLGNNVKIGSKSDLQGDIEIGDGVRIHSNVFIAKNAKIRNYVWLFPGVIITDDPHPPSNLSLGVTIDEFAVVAASSTILPGVNIGKGALVGANSLVNCDIPDESLAFGAPAKIIGGLSRIKLVNSPHTEAYPWRKYYHLGYPEDVISNWVKEFPET